MYILCLIFGITQVIMGRIIGLISIFTNSEMCYLVLPSKKCFYFANIIDAVSYTHLTLPTILRV